MHATPMSAKSPRRRDTSMKQARRTRPGEGQFDLHEHFVGLQRRGERAGEKILCGDPSFRFVRLYAHSAVKRQDDGRHFRRWVAVRKVAADGAAIADLRMRDMRQGFGASAAARRR